MGKKKKGAVCNNPIAMARAAGPSAITGPTIRDYLSRDRPSLDEAAAIIASQYGKKESGVLSVYEDQMNDSYRKELKKRREKLLSAASKKSSSDYRRSKERRSKERKSKEKDKKKRSKKRKKHRDRSRSRSSSPTSFTGDEENGVSRKDIHLHPAVPAREEHSPCVACSLIKSSPEPEKN